jgi:hypothetical protein
VRPINLVLADAAFYVLEHPSLLNASRSRRQSIVDSIGGVLANTIRMIGIPWSTGCSLHLTYRNETTHFWVPEIHFHSYTPNGLSTPKLQEYLESCEEARGLMADVERTYFRGAVDSDLQQVFSAPKATSAYDFTPYKPYPSTSVRTIRKSL